MVTTVHQLYQSLYYPTNSHNVKTYLMYVCPCIIYENDERHQLDAQFYLLS
jgi:hypothetical protein